ncbi:MAG: lyase [Firmicutes bacterium]|nr:lyase [Bacillota bacterium]
MKTALAMTTCLSLGLSASALANDNNLVDVSLSFQEWEVPFEGPRARDPWVVSSDEIWYVGQRSDYVGIFTPSTGEFKKIDLPEGAAPHTVVVNERGGWYAGNRAAHIGHVDRETHEITQIPLPGDGPRDVHTFDFTSDGNLWFTVQGGAQVGHFDTQSYEFTVYDASSERARPYGVIVHDDQPWFVFFGTNQIATVVDGELKEIDLPRESTRPRRLAVTDDGMVYYGDYADGYIGRYNPNNGEITEWRAPSEANSRPYAMTSDDEGRVWFVETGVQPNRFVAFDPETEKFSQPFEVPTEGGSVRHMVVDSDTHSIWFGTDNNTIGQATISN